MSSESPASFERLRADGSALLIIDLQQRLLDIIQEHAVCTWNARRLLDGARLFNVPVAATEQYPEKLGATAESLQLDLQPIPKRRFSCVDSLQEAGTLEQWKSENRFQVVLAGIEAHVCVLQTALDLLALGFQPFLVTDAIGARHPADREIALRRLEASGATLTTCESTLFEWCDDSSHPQFKALSALVQEPFPA